jgi:hypothetical protein
LEAADATRNAYRFRLRRELTAARSEAQQLRAASTELQRNLQDDEAAMTNLQSINADLQRQLQALDNITTFLAKVARGETGGEE